MLLFSLSLTSSRRSHSDSHMFTYGVTAASGYRTMLEPSDAVHFGTTVEGCSEAIVKRPDCDSEGLKKETRVPSAEIIPYRNRSVPLS